MHLVCDAVLPRPFLRLALAIFIHLAVHVRPGILGIERAHDGTVHPKRQLATASIRRGHASVGDRKRGLRSVVRRLSSRPKERAPRCPSHVLSRSLRSPPAPGHPPSSIRIHRQEVDDVGPVLTVLVAVAQEFGRDRRGSRSLNIRHGVRDLTTRNEPTARTINETTTPLRPAAALASEADPITLTLKPSAKRAEKIMSHPTSLT
jgi:hypothetical protein